MHPSAGVRLVEEALGQARCITASIVCTENHLPVQLSSRAPRLLFARNTTTGSKDGFVVWREQQD